MKGRQFWRIVPGGHRHNELSVPGLVFLNEVLDFPKITRERLEAMPHVDYGVWCDKNVPQKLTAKISPRHRGLMMPEIPALWFSREKLACLSVGSDGPDYTFIGWRERCVELAAASKKCLNSNQRNTHA